MKEISLLQIIILLLLADRMFNKSFEMYAFSKPANCIGNLYTES